MHFLNLQQQEPLIKDENGKYFTVPEVHIQQINM
jgi:hypothetical protein